MAVVVRREKSAFSYLVAANGFHRWPKPPVLSTRLTPHTGSKRNGCSKTKLTSGWRHDHSRLRTRTSHLLHCIPVPDPTDIWYSHLSSERRLWPSEHSRQHRPRLRAVAIDGLLPEQHQVNFLLFNDLSGDFQNASSCYGYMVWAFGTPYVPTTNGMLASFRVDYL